MFQSISCIALRTVKYDDRRSIVSVWTATHGRMSLSVASGASKEARRRRALMMPLSIFAAEADMRPGREIVGVRDVRPLELLPSIVTEPAKAATALFLAEVLERLLRQSAGDAPMWHFLTASIRRLDGMAESRGVAAFPLVFLYSLSRHLGIEPDMEGGGTILDLTGGRLRASAPLSGAWLDADATRYARLLSRLTYDTCARLRMSRTLRSRILDEILRYYTIHYAPLGHLNSLEVVRQIF